MSEFYICLNTFTFIFGTFGNFVCFLVYSRKKFEKISVSFFFKAISINNCVILLHKLRHYIQSAFNYNLKTSSDLSCKIVSYSVYSTISISTWIMVYVLLDRFVSIKFNKKFQFLHDFKFKFFILSSIHLISFCIYIPVVIDNQLTSKYLDFNETLIMYQCDLKSLDKLISIIDLIYSTLTPFILMIVFSILSIFVIFKSRIRLQSQNTRKNRLRKDIYFAFTSIILNFVFLATNLPITLVLLIQPDDDDFIDNLVYINCSISIFIHIFTNKIFYREFLALFGICQKKNSNIKKSKTII